MKPIERLNDAVFILAIPGVLLHEFTHWGFGKLGKGEPFVSNTKFGVPIEIDFEQPEVMSNWWIKLTGGAVFVYPVVMIGITGLHLPTPWELLSPVNVVVLYLSLAASGVSWLDLLAVHEPDKWVRYTNHKPISRKD